MGTPDFAVPCVEALVAHPSCDLVAVVCQPDKRRGRKKEPQPPPVKVAALEAGIEVLQPRRIKRGAFPERLEELAPDLIVVTAYGRILPPRILELPRLGCVNVHASLLPRWRGAAPIQWALRDGDAESGVCLMVMEEGLDTGAVYARTTTAITADDTGQTLHDRLSRQGAELLSAQLDALIAGELTPTPQDDAQTTYARMLTREDGRLDWSGPAASLDNHIRGFYPWPGAWTTLPGGKLLKLFPPVTITRGDGAPGEVLGCDGSGLTLACGEGAIRVESVQLQGKRRMAVSDFVRGFDLPAGTTLDPK